MFRPYIKRLIHSTIILVLFNSMYTHAAATPGISLPDEEILEFLESGPSWLPKPYKTPIEQGVLLDIDNLNKVVPGLLPGPVDESESDTEFTISSIFR